MSDKLDLIYDLLKQDREDASDFRKEVRDSHKDTGNRLTKLETASNAQNAQLAEHMRRTELLETMHTQNKNKINDHDGRLVELETPAKVFSRLKKWLIATAAVAAAVLTISKFLGLF